MEPGRFHLDRKGPTAGLERPESRPAGLPSSAGKGPDPAAPGPLRPARARPFSAGPGRDDCGVALRRRARAGGGGGGVDSALCDSRADRVCWFVYVSESVRVLARARVRPCVRASVPGRL